MCRGVGISVWIFGFAGYGLNFWFRVHALWCIVYGSGFWYRVTV